jgi:hypothetical protein
VPDDHDARGEYHAGQYEDDKCTHPNPVVVENLYKLLKSIKNLNNINNFNEKNKKF